MSLQLKKKDPLISLMNSMLINLPTPANISNLWNFGSMLGLCLMAQIISGILLSMHYSTEMTHSFWSIIYTSKEVNNGWLMRTLHMNGASMFFIMIYLHTARNIFYKLFNSKMVWTSGVTMMIMTMASAFLGYVLPYGQMSYWGATVITNLMSVTPYLGNMITQWMWGGFSVNSPTLNRFFSLHFVLPMVLMLTVMIHLMLLHENGSSNPLGSNSNTEKTPFHPFFTTKDLSSMLLPTYALLVLSMGNPFLLSDPENFNEANPLMTPEHIQPEWYFLFAYAILRAVPNKLGGVIALLMSLMVLYMLPMMKPPKKVTSFSPINNVLFWALAVVFMMLTWIGMNPVEEPFIKSGQILSVLYFYLIIKTTKI